MQVKYSTVKYADDVNIALVLELRKRIFTEEQGIPKELDNDGNDEEAYHILASVDQQHAGVGRLHFKDKLGVISRIAVAKEYRGHGIAGEIVIRLEKIAIDKSADELELYPHTHLCSFYEKLGFKQETSYTNSVAGHQLIKMYKKIRD